jgi:hypothetical protein
VAFRVMMYIFVDDSQRFVFWVESKRSHNPEDHDIIFYSREDLNSHKMANLNFC